MKKTSNLVLSVSTLCKLDLSSLAVIERKSAYSCLDSSPTEKVKCLVATSFLESHKKLFVGFRILCHIYWVQCSCWSCKLWLDQYLGCVKIGAHIIFLCPFWNLQSLCCFSYHSFSGLWCNCRSKTKIDISFLLASI